MDIFSTPQARKRKVDWGRKDFPAGWPIPTPPQPSPALENPEGRRVQAVGKKINSNCTPKG